MEQVIHDIILSKDYSDLSQDELNLLKDICSSEQEFLGLKKMYTQMRTIDESTVSTGVKKKLDELYAQTYAVNVNSKVQSNSGIKKLYSPNRSFFMNPLIQVAAVALIIVSVYQFIDSSDSVKSETQIAQLDTLNQQKEKKVTPLESEQEISSLGKQKNEFGETVKTPFIEISESANATNEVAEDFMRADEDTDFSEGKIQADMQIGTYSFTVPGTSVTTKPFVNHPDGIYVGDSKKIDYSTSAADVPDVLDLLTAAF